MTADPPELTGPAAIVFELMTRTDELVTEAGHQVISDWLAGLQEPTPGPVLPRLLRDLLAGSDGEPCLTDDGRTRVLLGLIDLAADQWARVFPPGEEPS